MKSAKFKKELNLEIDSEIESMTLKYLRLMYKIWRIEIKISSPSDSETEVKFENQFENFPNLLFSLDVQYLGSWNLNSNSLSSPPPSNGIISYIY